jgi:hypothetical protein
MHFQQSPVPRISISPPPPEDPVFEPYSPFKGITISSPDDGFRPVHLTPPPTSTHFKRGLDSPRIKQTADEAAKRGLESERFQKLLQATQERNAVAEAKKSVNLRKTLAVKVHKNKQAERRALFLSKVQAPPSPSATDTPKTPPDSPALFHFSLPSPGLVSPLALFETIEKGRDGWVEQVDFRLSGSDMSKHKPSEKRKPSMTLPSLDQISARMISRNIEDEMLTPTFSPRPSLDVGRLRMPLRTRPMNLDLGSVESPLLQVTTPELHVTTIVVPRTSSTSPIKLTEMNLSALNSRGQRAHNMLSTLRRRTSSFDAMCPTGLRLSVDPRNETKSRRHSAPPEMSCKPRCGFEHPVLTMVGAF